MPSRSRQILSTKVLAPDIISRASAQGIDLVCLPFIETIPINKEQLVSQLAPLAHQAITAIFTSANSVRAVAALLDRPPQWTIYCLFGATRQEVQKYFPASAVYADAENGAELAAGITAAGLTEVHFFCGDRRMDTIPERLTEAGLSWHQHTVYRTQLTPHTVAQTFEGVLFFSPSAVDSFFNVNPIAPATICYAVGPTTAGALRAHTSHIVIADTASQEAMLDKVIESMKENEKRY